MRVPPLEALNAAPAAEVPGPARPAAHLHLSRVSHLLDVGILLFSAQATIEYASRTALRLLGERSDGSELPPREVVEKVCAALGLEAGGETETRPVDLTVPSLADPPASEAPPADTPPAGRRRLRLHLHPLEESCDSGYLVLVRDRGILEALETDLRTATKLRALTRLYKGMAHDLKAPLNNLGLHLALLQRKFETAGSAADGAGSGAPADGREDSFAALRQELALLERELDRLLEQTAPASYQAEVFDLGTLLREVAALVAPQARLQEVRQHLAVPERAVCTRGHRDRIKQALVNVAINALDAMPAGGALEMTLNEENGWAEVLVRDTGPGIAEPHRQRVFDLHFTTRQTGTGIGLYVARTAIEEEGGSLGIAETSASGTTFAFRLRVTDLR